MRNHQRQHKTPHKDNSKSLGKTKKHRIWCVLPGDVKTLGTACGRRKFGNKLKQPYGKDDFQIPKNVVCPDCQKKFKPKIWSCGDYNCWHWSIPAHKKWVKIPKNKDETSGNECSDGHE